MAFSQTPMTAVLEKLPLNVQRRFTLQNMRELFEKEGIAPLLNNAELTMQPTIDGMIMSLRSWVYSSKQTQVVTFEVPDTWWDAFKQAAWEYPKPVWIPSVLWYFVLGKLRVKWTTLRKDVPTTVICPHVNLATQSDREHIYFYVNTFGPGGDKATIEFGK